jgi:ATP-dependent protease HslVU (ClpYQ) ATPase subunit
MDTQEINIDADYVDMRLQELVKDEDLTSYIL